MTDILRTVYDPRTGKEYRVNLRTGVVCGTDGTSPDKDQEARIFGMVARRAKAARARRDRDAALRSLGLTKVRGNLGGTYWE